MDRAAATGPAKPNPGAAHQRRPMRSLLVFFCGRKVPCTHTSNYPTRQACSFKGPRFIFLVSQQKQNSQGFGFSLSRCLYHIIMRSRRRSEATTSIRYLTVSCTHVPVRKFTERLPTACPYLIKSLFPPWCVCISAGVHRRRSIELHRKSMCWTYSHHCQIADKKPSKRSWNGEFRGFRICVG